MKTTKQAELFKVAAHEIDHAEQYTQRTLQTWRDQVAEKDSSPGYLIGAFGEQQIEAEFMLRWIKAIRYSISDEGHGLENLLIELERSCDSWNPCNSTSLLSRLRGDIELKAMRAARKLVRLILKTNTTLDA